MNAFGILLIVAIVFAICYLVDKFFSKLFRNKAQHRSGLAVRVSKQYGIFGVGLSILGLLSIGLGIGNGIALAIGGVVVLAMGLCLGIYYLSHGIFYDGESFLVASFRQKDRVYRYSEIQEQRLYLVQGGSVIIELHMQDNTTVSVLSTMDGVYLFLDTAFAGWCLQNGIDPAECDFHDPNSSWWFPHEEEV
ncbi:MAG: hypothetical protein IKU68_03910 [Oscillospiraceae bacterium]|nr:hypothetical protein [Oscillospiraceae bacterium]